MNVRINHHPKALTAGTWSPTGAKVAFIATPAERDAVANAARMMVSHAISQIGYSPVGQALETLRKAVG